jgi:hypothetical protein
VVVSRAEGEVWSGQRWVHKAAVSAARVFCASSRLRRRGSMEGVCQRPAARALPVLNARRERVPVVRDVRVVLLWVLSVLVYGQTLLPSRWMEHL